MSDDPTSLEALVKQAIREAGGAPPNGTPVHADTITEAVTDADPAYTGEDVHDALSALHKQGGVYQPDPDQPLAVKLTSDPRDGE